MKTRIIHTKIWKDNWFQSLSRSSSLIFIYLLTCESNNICGTFELPDRNIMFDVKVNAQELEQAKKDLSGKILFYESWIHIRNTERYNNYITNEKLQVAYKKEMALIPSKVKESIKEYDTSIDTSMYTSTIPLIIINHKSKTINNKSKIINEEDLQEISDKYKVPISLVKLAKEEMDNWLQAKGKKYTDYKAGLRNWVLRDAKRQIEGRQNVKSRVSIDIEKI